MLHINDLTYRIEGKLILEAATAAIPQGHKVGLIGRNGAGKTTLLRLLKGEISPDDGTISTPRNAKIGHVAQEAPGGDDTLIEWVLAADTERASLLGEAEHASDPNRIGEIQLRLTDINAHSAPARAAQILSGLGFDASAQARACRDCVKKPSGSCRKCRSSRSAISSSSTDIFRKPPNRWWSHSMLVSTIQPHTAGAGAPGSSPRRNAMQP